MRLGEGISRPSSSKTYNGGPARRLCLKCCRWFDSLHKGHRRCDDCALRLQSYGEVYTMPLGAPPDGRRSRHKTEGQGA